jgi:glycosyltransferase involved in cell wall biosynthesis
MRSLCFIVESGTDVRLVEGLAQRFQLSVVARRIDGGVEISQAPAPPVLVTVGPAERIKFAWFLWRYLRKNRREIDHVLVQNYGIAALVANLAGIWFRLPTTMLICSPMESYYRCRQSNSNPGKPFRRRELFLLLALARINALLARHYVVLSEHLAEVVRGHGARAISVIPVYGVSTDVFSPARETKPAIRSKLGLPATGSLIFFSSRIAPEKDSETLLTAVRNLLDKGLDIWLLHRSGGYQRFLQEARRFGIESRVIATNAVHPHKELPLDYQASDLCIQASRQEGLGFSPLEALACETPVVAASVGGLKETIVDGKTGWTYPVGDAIALAKCIEEAIGDRVEAARRATAGRELVRSSFEGRDAFANLERAIINTSKQRQAAGKEFDPGFES